MGISNFGTTMPLLLVVLLLSLSNMCLGSRKLAAIYQAPPMSLKYHKGHLLEGDLPVSILWYGDFKPSQKSIIADFFLSLDHPETHSPQPSVSRWWNLIQTYMKKAGKKETHPSLSNQFQDKNCSLGKTLKKSHITHLANNVIKSRKPAGLSLTLILTSDDVAVEGFCMSSCGFHGSNAEQTSPFIWVGNSATQCPGQCAWPFHQPIYGPQTPPLLAPNGDVGVDGMVINVASLLAGAVTNPFRDGYYVGPADGAVEVASACTGVYGKGAYPGYAGELPVDPVGGGSYNAVGFNGRKFVLPALFDPSTSRCLTVV